MSVETTFPLTLQTALLGTVTPRMHSVAYKLGSDIHKMRFFFLGGISESDYYSVSEISAEMHASFETIETTLEIINDDDGPQLLDGEMLAFQRASEQNILKTGDTRIDPTYYSGIQT